LWQQGRNQRNEKISERKVTHLGRREMSEMAPITILAMPKPFHGDIGTIQRNAITSWTKLRPRPEIILFGREEGIAECARELCLVHIPDVARNSHGTPLLADIFAKAERRASHDVLAYINSDIILSANFSIGVDHVHRKFSQFLAVGRRTNLAVREPLDFSEGWEEKLKECMRREGWLESHTSIDCFVFRRRTYEEVPPLAIGRVWFDQWCIKYARKKGMPVVDLTEFAPIVHQTHDYSHVAGGREWVYNGAEANENLVYYDERPHTYTILSATHLMTKEGRIRRAYFRKEIFAARNVLWDIFIHRTRSARKRLGLSKDSHVKKSTK
jgi:hypothetical protein